MGDPNAPLAVQLKNLEKRLSVREKTREDARARRVVRFFLSTCFSILCSAPAASSPHAQTHTPPLTLQNVNDPYRNASRAAAPAPQLGVQVLRQQLRGAAAPAVEDSLQRVFSGRPKLGATAKGGRHGRVGGGF